ncbi:glycosyl hydrolase family 39 [Motilibacter rhizosphaerae]|uniref:Glycosyl hydrolase family 39 n=1 Tax=Motilibacter rhizosphaerae TaxID=598652 RepID=A0A4V2F3E0_9ACTN|nr:glycosyl hydrolase [Motilibacter rhizosphaerae]RZS82783.1 glycosyl hydrolase family 39 [Motilibacter rhizosphaerae]
MRCRTPHLSRSVLHTAVTGALLAVLAALAPAPPAAAAPATISRALFGLHQTGIASASWPDAEPGTVRLWDTGTRWADVEPSRGRFDWTALDHAVATARAHHASVLLVLGQTPRWASSRPSQISTNGLGAAAMPRSITYWREYVAAVAHRYRGRIAAYQVWNEPNVQTFFTGTPKQMVQLTQEAQRLVKHYDKRAIVSSPSFATRLRTNIPWMQQWLAAGGARYVDVVSLHLYPLPTSGPEGSMTLLAKARAALAKAKVSKPVWDTEINYGAGVGGAPARHFSSASGAAYVARTYLLSAANGVSRVYWYGWDTSGPLSISLSKGGEATVAGEAYRTVEDWMVGAKGYGCTRDRAGTYTCLLRYPGSWGKVVWNPGRAFGMRAPAGTVSVNALDGTWRSARRGSRVQVSGVPVMIRTTVR